MVDILSDLSPANLINACELNLASWLDVFSQLDGVQLDDIPGLRRAITNIPMPFFNSIMETHLTAENVASTIEAVKLDASHRGVPVIWWVSPSTRPTDLASRLVDHGFVVDEDGPAMAVELDRLNERNPAPEGVSVLPALEDSAWQSWCKALMEGFEAPPNRFDFGFQQWYKLLGRSDPATTLAFTAWQDGAPVATSLLQLGGGVAGIYAVATVPQARRKGIGAQVTLQALKYAKNQGYKIGLLESSPMGLSMYRSLGFREFCRITSYFWKNKTE